MRAFVVKDGVDRELMWEVGRDPVITKTIEENRLFAFRAPFVRFVIDDGDGRFLPGGEWEIQRGDVVYVLAGDPIPGSRSKPDTVEVFRGTVDRDILHNPEAGEISFRAMGFLAQLKEIYLGIPFRMNDNLVTEKYRWVKEITDDDVEGDDDLNGESWEYRAFSTWYDQASRTEKTGYRKEYIFDSRGGLDIEPFCGLVYEKVEEGLYRRLSTEGGLTNITFDQVISKIQQMLNFDEESWRIDYDPGEIPGEIDVVIKDKNYTLIHIFKTRYGNPEQDHIFFAGWNDGEGAEIYEIVNYTQAAHLVTLDFGYVQGEVASFYTNPNNAWISEEMIFRNFLWSKLEEGRIIYYEIFSYVGQAPYDGTDFEENPYVARRRVVVEWYDINLETGGIENHRQFSHLDIVIKAGEDRSATRNDVIKMADIDFMQEVEPVYSTSLDKILDGRVEFAGGLYYADGQVVSYAGPRGLLDIQFDLRDAHVSDMLLEICKLTNSAMWVDYENGIKVIKIVGRDKTGTLRVLNNRVLLTGYRRGVSDYYGDRTPQIQSGILLNRHHLAALREYYESEFPLKEEVFTLRLDDDPVSVAIGLGDSLMLPKSLGRGIEPAKVSKVEIRAGAVKLEARRSYE